MSLCMSLVTRYFLFYCHAHTQRETVRLLEEKPIFNLWGRHFQSSDNLLQCYLSDKHNYDGIPTSCHICTCTVQKMNPYVSANSKGRWQIKIKSTCIVPRKQGKLLCNKILPK